MCGILGVISKQNTTNQSIFLNALNLMEHRGPDGFGVLHNQYISFGHRRLSIIDLSSHANQPLSTDEQKLSIVFNGEIYNYKEISSDLILTTTSDTEVLLKGYEKHGVDFFHKIRGIYAICIFDNRDSDNPKCILLRDPAGVKPMYTARTENGVILSSEIKSIIPLLNKKPVINELSIKKYIHLGYCPEPETAYVGINALTPGICYTYYINSNTFTEKVILTYQFEAEAMDENLALTKTQELLDVACVRNMVADVKVNVALSGGIDSSLIYAYTNKHNNNTVTGITVGFEDSAYDESEAAQAHANYIGAPQQIEKTDVDNKLELLNKLLLNFDQPYADSSFIPFYFLSKAAAKHSKVLIGGDSGDEIHNGYMGFRVLPYLNQIQKYKLNYPAIWVLSALSPFVNDTKKRIIRKFIGLLKTKNLAELVFYWESWFPPDASMYKENPFNYSLADVMPAKQQESDLAYITKEYFVGRMQSDYLRKSDMMSMLNSLEFRVPMLDEDLTKFSLSIPYHYKSNRKTTKIILRKLHGLIYPEHLTKLPKKGFTIPLDTWLGTENLNAIKNKLMQPNTYYTKYINRSYVTTLFESLNNPKNESYISRAGIYQRILIIYSLEIWHESL